MFFILFHKSLIRFDLVPQQTTLLAQGGQQHWVVTRSQVRAQEQHVLVLVQYIWLVVEVSCIQLVLEYSLLLELLVLFTQELQIVEQRYIILFGWGWFILLNIELDILEEFDKPGVVVALWLKLRA